MKNQKNYLNDLLDILSKKCNIEQIDNSNYIIQFVNPPYCPLLSKIHNFILKVKENDLIAQRQELEED